MKKKTEEEKYNTDTVRSNVLGCSGYWLIIINKYLPIRSGYCGDLRLIIFITVQVVYIYCRDVRLIISITVLSGLNYSLEEIQFPKHSSINFTFVLGRCFRGVCYPSGKQSRLSREH